MGFIIVIMVCILGALSRGSLFLEWVCLEVNMMAVIPLLCSGYRETSMINRMKYFISQRVASLIFIITFLTNHETLIAAFCSLAILFKIGIPPFHSWLVRIICNIKYFELFLLIRVQKFIPLAIISQFYVATEIFIVIALRTFLMLLFNLNLVSSIGVLFFLSARGNGLWVIRVAVKTELWLVFLVVYCFVVICSCALLSKFGVYKLGDLHFLKVRNLKLLSFQFLNIGGLPPITGFVIKLIMIKVLINFRGLETLLLVANSLIILYIYVVFIYQCFTITPAKRIVGLSKGSQKLITLLVFVRRRAWVLFLSV